MEQVNEFTPPREPQAVLTWCVSERLEPYRLTMRWPRKVHRVRLSNLLTRKEAA